MSTLREQIAEIVADAINRWKDASISGNLDAWAGVGSKSVTDATEAILALLPLQPEGEVVTAEERRVLDTFTFGEFRPGSEAYAKREGEEQGASVDESALSLHGDSTSAEPSGGGEP